MNKQKKSHTLLALAMSAFVAVASVPLFPVYAHENHDVPADENSESQQEPEFIAPVQREVQEIEPFILLPSYQCIWRKSVQVPSHGGIGVQCEAGEVPFVSATTGDAEFIGCPMTNLSPARGGDGRINGEPLTEGHADIHGEPIETNDTDLGDLSQRKRIGATKHISPKHRDDERCDSRADQQILVLCCTRDFPFDERPK